MSSILLQTLKMYILLCWCNDLKLIVLESWPKDSREKLKFCREHFLLKKKKTIYLWTYWKWKDSSLISRLNSSVPFDFGPLWEGIKYDSIWLKTKQMTKFLTETLCLYLSFDVNNLLNTVKFQGTLLQFTIFCATNHSSSF